MTSKSLPFPVCRWPLAVNVMLNLSIKEDDTPLLGSETTQKMGLVIVKHENIMNVNEAVNKTDILNDFPRRKLMPLTAMFLKALNIWKEIFICKYTKL